MADLCVELTANALGYDDIPSELRAKLERFSTFELVRIVLICVKFRNYFETHDFVQVPNRRVEDSDLVTFVLKEGSFFNALETSVAHEGYDCVDIIRSNRNISNVYCSPDKAVVAACISTPHVLEVNLSGDAAPDDVLASLATPHLKRVAFYGSLCLTPFFERALLTCPLTVNLASWTNTETEQLAKFISSAKFKQIDLPDDGVDENAVGEALKQNPWISRVAWKTSNCKLVTDVLRVNAAILDVCLLFTQEILLEIPKWRTVQQLVLLISSSDVDLSPLADPLIANRSLSYVQIYCKSDVQLPAESLSAFLEKLFSGQVETTVSSVTLQKWAVSGTIPPSEKFFLADHNGNLVAKPTVTDGRLFYVRFNANTYGATFDASSSVQKITANVAADLKISAARLWSNMPAGAKLSSLDLADVFIFSVSDRQCFVFAWESLRKVATDAAIQAAEDATKRKASDSIENDRPLKRYRTESYILGDLPIDIIPLIVKHIFKPVW
jgi:hypothetical protein